MLDAMQLIALVDAAESLDPIRRSLMLWSAVAADPTPDALWNAPVGCRDRALLELRAEAIGRTIELADRCARCAEAIEFSIDVESLRLTTPALDNPVFSVDAGVRTLCVRHVSCGDLAAVASDPALDLLLRCVLDAPASALSAHERAAVDAALAAGDPQADLSFELECPSCKHRWSTLLDIGEVLWTELKQRAQRLLLEVDAIARVYHWSERDILQLPASRRRYYFELVAP